MQTPEWLIHKAKEPKDFRWNSYPGPPRRKEFPDMLTLQFYMIISSHEIKVPIFKIIPM